ncbi:MAG: hypothetical protein GY754_27460 [bacterium]|nr:hypothetical protein [bacterium]
MDKKEKIKLFAQNTLGCGCSEEVFAVIDCRENEMINAELQVDKRINIGNRLLVYIIETVDNEYNNRDFIEDIFPALIRAGKEDRDSHGFNRFRLAIVQDTINEMAEKAENIFQKIKGDDEKLHLHIIKTNEYTLHHTYVLPGIK